MDGHPFSSGEQRLLALSHPTSSGATRPYIFCPLLPSWPPFIFLTSSPDSPAWCDPLLGETQDRNPRRKTSKVCLVELASLVGNQDSVLREVCEDPCGTRLGMVHVEDRNLGMLGLPSPPGIQTCVILNWICPLTLTKVCGGFGGSTEAKKKEGGVALQEGSRPSA